ncbi:MAG: hypothetical protein GY724_15765 [Actinomycetia bacterium]|nr:hypothetical protein [Actinomycetes bacterium]MCP5033138.1 hypothetical protein [Actinomycetes bacterium]
MAATTKKPMSTDHKEALAIGRAEGRSVRAYLEALESSRPKRGRKRTKDSISTRLESITTELEVADPLKRLQLAQEELDLTVELEAMDQAVDLTDLQSDFVDVAKSYAARKGISYTAFRQVGVPASVLKDAGISRAGV